MYYFGLDIGGTKTALSLGKAEKDNVEILFREEVKTTTSPEETLKSLLTKAKDLKKNYKIESVGVSCGGPLDSEKGIILWRTIR